MAWPGLAKPLPESGPIASANIDISVSVARRYGLGVTADPTGRMELKSAGGAPFCIASNAAEHSLPVMLSWLRPGEEADIGLRAAGKAVALPPCGAFMRSFDGLRRQEGTTGPEAVIVRPE